MKTVDLAYCLRKGQLHPAMVPFADRSAEGKQQEPLEGIQPVDAMALRTAGISLVTPVAVSLWVASTGLDLVLRVLRQDLGVFFDRDAFPLDLQGLHIQLVALAQIDEEVAEVPETGGQYLVPGREGVRDPGLPAAGARGREEEDLAVFALEGELVRPLKRS